MKYENLNDWAKRQPSKRIEVRRPEQTIPNDHGYTILMADGYEMCSYFVLAHAQDSCLWRKNIADTLREMRLDLHKQRGEGVILA